MTRLNAKRSGKLSRSGLSNPPILDTMDLKNDHMIRISGDNIMLLSSDTLTTLVQSKNYWKWHGFIHDTEAMEAHFFAQESSSAQIFSSPENLWVELDFCPIKWASVASVHDTYIRKNSWGSVNIWKYKIFQIFFYCLHYIA